MNFNRITLAAIVGTITYYVFGAIGGALFANVYRPYTAVFRSRDVIMGYLPFGLAGTLVAMFVAATIYAWGYKGGGAAAGLRFGFLLGVFVIFACVVHDYVIVNVGRDVELVEALGQLVGWSLSGVAIGLIYRPAQVIRP
jgi:hypothetical protein